MLPSDTIIALASGWGHSPRALVRLSGPDLAGSIGPLLDGDLPGHQRIGPVRLKLGDSISLPVLALFAAGPRSYTGQDCLELLIPGNPLLIERVLAACTALPGVREAAPGEFTARAYLAGKLTLEQAESVAATIAARTQDELDAATAIASGQTFARYRACAEEIATLLALVEAGVDFTDQEDVVPISPPELFRRLHELAGEIRSELGSQAGSEQASLQPVAVLAGEPNAGKSTLFNALLGRCRAVVSPVAGTTRDVLREKLDLSRWSPGARSISLVDLAGLDQALSAASAIDAESQRAAREAIATSDIVIHCDPSGRFRPLTTVSHASIIRVRTKGDLPTASVPSRAEDADPAIPVCALDGWNLGSLARAIADAAARPASGTGVWLLPRHRAALARSLHAIETASSLAAGRSMEAELVAGSLRESLDAFAELTGRLSPDDIIGRIFATFCIGK